MVFEILIIISAAAIFIILAKRLPETEDVLPPISDNMAQVKANLRVTTIFKNVRSRLSGLKSFRPSLPKRGKKVNPDIWATPHAQAISSNDLTFEAEQLLKAGDLRSAEKLYLKAASKTPGNAKIYSHLGTIYLQQKDFADARDAFLAALKIDETVASRHYNLGLAYMGLKTNEKAKVSLKRAIQLDPSKTKYQETLKKIS